MWLNGLASLKGGRNLHSNVVDDEHDRNQNDTCKDRIDEDQLSSAHLERPRGSSPLAAWCCVADRVPLGSGLTGYLYIVS